MQHCVLGVDPGLSGALSFYWGDHLDIFDMPTLPHGKKRAVDVYEVARIVDMYSQATVAAYIENVHSMPNQGVASSFNFGMSCGLVRGVIAANFIPVEMVTPQVWKRYFSLTSDKTLARREAFERFPKNYTQFVRVKDDGRAEASLIALYGYITGGHDA